MVDRGRARHRAPNGKWEKECRMLSFLGNSTGRNCDGSTRRDFLKVGALGLGGLTLPGLLRARAQGAVAAKVRGNHPRTGMPPYISLNRIYGDGPAYLGVSSAPFEAGGQAKQNMSLAGGIDLNRLGDRRGLLKSLDRLCHDIDAQGLI